MIPKSVYNSADEYIKRFWTEEDGDDTILHFQDTWFKVNRKIRYKHYSKLIKYVAFQIAAYACRNDLWLRNRDKAFGEYRYGTGITDPEVVSRIALNDMKWDEIESDLRSELEQTISFHYA